MLDTLVREGGHGLMIYPTKALAFDQREQLERLARHIGEPRIESWWYDGDTPPEIRTVLRGSPPSIIITNPDMLHNSFLAHCDKWNRVLDDLRWVIVDEVHEYRGYFGSNVAMILRRLSHHLAKRHVHPQFFLCSATCSNAREHAESLTGLLFEEINAGESMRPERQFYFVQPRILGHRYWDILQLRVVNSGLACMAHEKSVLVFCPTRKFAESCHGKASRRVEDLRESGVADLDLDAIRVFRAGLSTEERQKIQNGLKSGEIRLAFTTNALELGIDIGSLDGVILAGFPDSMMSAWQRIGRAGRHWNAKAFVVYFARNNPLDRFYAANLRMFLDKPLDDLVINPGNETLVDRHVPCLLYETPNLNGGKHVLGSPLHAAALEKLQAGFKPVVMGNYRPHFGLDIRGGGGGMYALQHGSQEIGTMSQQQQFREAYQDAIYMHGGATYRVAEVSAAATGGTITLARAEPFLRTNAYLVATVQDQTIFSAHRWTAGSIALHAAYGQVSITEANHNIEEIDERTGEVLRRWKPEFNSARFSNAHAFWLTQETGSAGTPGSLAALQHILRLGVLFSIRADAHDTFSHSVANQQKVYICENYSGGIGIVEKVLVKWRTILEVGIGVAEACGCKQGCPNCIVPPRSRDELDKRAGISLARSLLRATRADPDFEFVNGLWEPRGTRP